MTEPRHAAPALDGPPPGGVPLPEPGVLRQYDEILPGFARQVLDAAREEVEHRRRLERAESLRRTLGQVLAPVVALSFVVTAYRLVAGGHEAAGVALGALDIVALAAAFVLGRRGQ
jgi:uncharacterized membrane protein